MHTDAISRKRVHSCLSDFFVVGGMLSPQRGHHRKNGGNIASESRSLQHGVIGGGAAGGSTDPQRFIISFFCVNSTFETLLLLQKQCITLTDTMGVGTGGAEGAAAPPTFGMGEQAIALAPPKV